MPAPGRGPINTRPFKTRPRLCVHACLSAAHPVHRVGRAARKPGREMAREMERSCDREKGKEKEGQRQRERRDLVYVLATLKRVAHGA